jgi:uncharacterized membrane protein
MFLLRKSQTGWVLLGLISLMAATRSPHFGSAMSLPDASLAAFFLAGLYLRSHWILALLLVEAGLLDYLVITYGGVSSWCVSPAYVFLIPSYAAMWWAGQWCSRFDRFSKGMLLAFAGTLPAATALAFLIANGSFYLFSGRFPEMNWVEYATGVAQYYPLYLISTLLYLGAALGLHVLLHAWHGLARREVTSG